MDADMTEAERLAWEASELARVNAEAREAAKRRREEQAREAYEQYERERRQIRLTPQDVSRGFDVQRWGHLFDGMEEALKLQGIKRTEVLQIGALQRIAAAVEAMQRDMSYIVADMRKQERTRKAAQKRAWKERRRAEGL